MKILIISQYFWPENFRINEVVKFFTSSGYEVEVLTGEPNYPGVKFIKIIYLNQINIKNILEQKFIV